MIRTDKFTEWKHSNNFEIEESVANIEDWRSADGHRETEMVFVNQE